MTHSEKAEQALSSSAGGGEKPKIDYCDCGNWSGSHCRPAHCNRPPPDKDAQGKSDREILAEEYEKAGYLQTIAVREGKAWGIEPILAAMSRARSAGVTVDDAMVERAAKEISHICPDSVVAADVARDALLAAFQKGQE